MAGMLHRETRVSPLGGEDPFGSTHAVRTIVAMSALWIGVALVRPVDAYIDPGTGSMLYQALLAGLLGVGFTFRRVLGTFLHWFRRRQPREEITSSPRPPQP
jgi:hypothetical protein